MTEQSSNKRMMFYIIVVMASLWIASCKSENDTNSIRNDRTWSVYKADEGSSSHSPLDQINTSNVTQLKSAWTFQINDLTQSAQPANTQERDQLLQSTVLSMLRKCRLFSIVFSINDDLKEAEKLQMKITRIGSQASATGPGEWFTGSVRIDPLFQPNDSRRAAAAMVTFELVHALPGIHIL